MTCIQAGTNTLSGIISDDGTGAFTQAGTGTTVLTAANTYTGATTVTAGTLQIGNGTTGSISNASAVSVSGGATLVIDEANGSTQSNAITDNGTVAGIEGAGVTNTLSGGIGGGGVFTQSGAGTTVLGGTNGYTGATTVSAGTLNLTGVLSATSGVTTSGAGIVSESGAGSINGAATFAQGSSGTSILAGQQRLYGRNDGQRGHAQSDRSAERHQPRHDQRNGRLFGDWRRHHWRRRDLRPGSSGSSVLNNANTYSGGTTVSAGTLLVGNSGAWEPDL